MSVTAHIISIHKCVRLYFISNIRNFHQLSAQCQNKYFQTKCFGNPERTFTFTVIFIITDERTLPNCTAHFDSAQQVGKRTNVI